MRKLLIFFFCLGLAASLPAMVYHGDQEKSQVVYVDVNDNVVPSLEVSILENDFDSRSQEAEVLTQENPADESKDRHRWRTVRSITSTITNPYVEPHNCHPLLC
jgi:hypothetical protein